MRLRDWIFDTDDEANDENDADSQDGGEEGSPLVNPEEYSEREILEDKTRLEDQRRQAERELKEFRSKYEKLIQKGQQENVSDERRKELAHRANMLKKKYNAVKQKYNDIRNEMALVVSVEAAREVMSLVDRDNRSNISELVESGDLSTDQVQKVMEQKRVEHGIKRKEMNNAISALDVDMVPQESQLDETPEYEMMKDGSEDELDGEKLLDEEMEEDEDLGIQGGIDTNIDTDGVF
jgi:hypothetical protein